MRSTFTNSLGADLSADKRHWVSSDLSATQDDMMVLDMEFPSLVFGQLFCSVWYIEGAGVVWFTYQSSNCVVVSFLVSNKLE